MNAILDTVFIFADESEDDEFKLLDEEPEEYATRGGLDLSKVTRYLDAGDGRIEVYLDDADECMIEHSYDDFVSKLKQVKNIYNLIKAN